MKGQSEFTDYDFEGSGLSVLLDVLAYNTHYNAFMANMLANEMFLDTSVKRSSVVSHAKRLGYTPVSAKAPVAYVNVNVGDAVSGSELSWLVTFATPGNRSPLPLVIDHLQR